MQEKGTSRLIPRTVEMGIGRQSYGRSRAAQSISARGVQRDRRGVAGGHIFELRSKPGRGRTTVLRPSTRRWAGRLLTMRDFSTALIKRHPLAMEEAYFELLLAALRSTKRSSWTTCKWPPPS